MAEAPKEDMRDKVGLLECAVCLQKCVHPAQLPCGHIFCFLCIKGFANQNKKCAMCRQEIPRDFTEHPYLLEEPSEEPSEGFDEGYQWFYEGRNGWWQYDERTSKDLEISYKKGEKTCELLIAGFLYIVDLENMLQIRRNDPARRRRVKRDFATIPKKGVAGLHTGKEVVSKLENSEAHVSSNQQPNIVLTTSNLNSVETNNSASVEDDYEDITQGINSLNINNTE